MTLPEYLQRIAAEACPAFRWYYDIRSMQNVTADNAAFPALWMEEYYAQRVLDRYGFQRELTMEIHFQDLVPMQGVAADRERVRDHLMQLGVMPFVQAYNRHATAQGLGLISEFTADPEPPMFDANTTGVLLRFTVTVPMCMTFTDPS